MAADSSVTGKRLVFLVGAPRSGTTWVQLMLASADEVATANESHLFSVYLTSLFDAWDRFRSDVRQVGIHHLVTEDEYLSLGRNFASEVMARILAKKPNASVILEKTPAHVMTWREILKVFPDAYFIHLVRDPRSLQAAQATWGSDWLSPRLVDHCTRWRSRIKQGREIANHTKNYIEVRYEDFITDGQQTLRSVFAGIGIERTPSECDEIIDRYAIDKLRSGTVANTPWDLAAEPQGFYRRGSAEGWASDLSPNQIFLIETMTRDDMSIFGYQPSSGAALMSRLVSLQLALFRERIRAGLHWRTRHLAQRLSPRF